MPQSYAMYLCYELTMNYYVTIPLVFADNTEKISLEL